MDNYRNGHRRGPSNDTQAVDVNRVFTPFFMRSFKFMPLRRSIKTKIDLTSNSQF